MTSNWASVGPPVICPRDAASIAASRVYLPDRNPPASGAPGHDAHPGVERQRDELALDRAGEQRVLDLQCDDRRPGPQHRDGVRLRGDPGGGVREADVADLARGDEVVERAHRLLDRRVGVPVVQPVQVEVVGLHPAQGLLELGHDRLASGAAAVGVAGVHVPEELAGQHEAVTETGSRREEVADDLLGMPVRVEVGGVDEVAAAVEVGLQHALGLGDARAPAALLAERHGPEGKGADAQTGAPEGEVVIEFHGSGSHHRRRLRHGAGIASLARSCSTSCRL